MKKLIVILFPFVAFTQNVKYDYIIRDSVEFYFMQLLNDYRRETYPNIPILIKSQPFSQASLHHTKYLLNMYSVDGYGFILTHDELVYDNSSNISYKGNDTLINDIAGRSAYYDTNKEFIGYSEVCQTAVVYKSILSNDKKLAYDILQGFLNSAMHKQILDNYEYTHIGISIIQATNGPLSKIIVCVRPCALSNTRYLRSNTFFPYYYGNKLKDIK
jgi:hypothetical protein